VAEPSLTRTGDGRWLLEGDLSFSSVPAMLKFSPRAMTAGRVIKVDLKGVSRADSAGLALLVEWLRESERAGKVIVFTNVPQQLQDIALLCGLDGILSFRKQGEKQSNDRQ